MNLGMVLQVTPHMRAWADPASHFSTQSDGTTREAAGLLMISMDGI
jgi:hypothetical protein